MADVIVYPWHGYPQKFADVNGVYFPSASFSFDPSGPIIQNKYGLPERLYNNGDGTYSRQLTLSTDPSDRLVHEHGLETRFRANGDGTYAQVVAVTSLGNDDVTVYRNGIEFVYVDLGDGTYAPLFDSGSQTLTIHNEYGLEQGIGNTQSSASVLLSVSSATFALDFARDPYATLHPAFSHVRATESTLIRQYDGSHVQMLPNEFGLDGGRRVENLLSDTDTLSTQSVDLVDGREYTLAFTGTGSVTITGTGSGTLAGTGVADRVSLTFTASAAGSATFTISGSCADGQLEIGDAASEYVSKGVEILGAEQITNGTFASDLDGWSALVNATWEAGRMRVANGQALQLAVIPTGTAGTFAISWDQTVNSGTRARLRVRNGADTGDAGYLNYHVGSGSQTVTVSVTNGLSLLFLVEAADDVSFDNISVKPILHHGWGVDGVRWLNTGPNGEDLTDPANGFAVVAKGVVRNPAVTNLWPYANPTVAQLVGGGGCTDEAGFAGLPRSIGFPDNTTTRYAYRALNLTGDHVVQVVMKMDDGGTPNTSTDFRMIFQGALLGTALNVEDLGNGLFLVWATSTASGVNQNYGIIKYSGSAARGFKVLLFQVHAGTEPKPFVLTDGLSATADADVFPHDIAEIGGTEGTWIVEHTAAQSPSVDAGSQTLLDLYADANNRARVYNPSGNLGVQVTDGGVSQWSASDAGANWTAGTLQRLAVRFETDDGSLVTDGDERLSDASMSVPDATVAYIGGDASSEYSGSIARIAYVRIAY